MCMFGDSSGLYRNFYKLTHTHKCNSTFTYVLINICIHIYLQIIKSSYSKDNYYYYGEKLNVGRKYFEYILELELITNAISKNKNKIICEQKALRDTREIND